MRTIVKMIKNIGWTIARKLARIGIIWPFVLVYRSVIEEVEPRKRKSDSRIPTLLALNAPRFRREPEILSKNGIFRVLKIHGSWQSRINSLFLTREIQFSEHFKPDDSLLKMQNELEVFLEKFLRSLYKKLKVNCVLSSTMGNISDYYWGIASEEIGVPYIVLQKESIATLPKHIEWYYNRAKTMGKFKGSYIITQNGTIRDIFMRAGFVGPEKIGNFGCLRMDDFIKKLRTPDKAAGARKKVVLFSFTHRIFLQRMPPWSKDGKTGLVGLFRDVHSTIARLAVRNPDIDFVIKPKGGGEWIRRIVSTFDRDIKKINNLSILPDCNVHDLILSSDVVCGFGSTTLLEGAIARKPVIIPYFDEISRPEHDDAIPFKDDFHLFDIAYSVEEFEDLILKRLNSPEISEECMSQRFRMFEKYISNVKGDALNKYVSVIRQVIDGRFPEFRTK